MTPAKDAASYIGVAELWSSTGRVFALLCILLSASLATAVDGKATVRLSVIDQTGVPHHAWCNLSGPHGEWKVESGADGVCAFASIAPGTYRGRVVSAGFQPSGIEVRVTAGTSVNEQIVVRPSAGNTTVDVTASPVLATTNVQVVASRELRREITPQAARGLIGVVRQQPGWLLEANGVLHPRGSEYDTQYVVDGVPVFENRSPAFAPALDLSGVDTVEVRTSGYPASYGRKLGGVVEVRHRAAPPAGFHGNLDMDAGSFQTGQVSIDVGYAGRATSMQVSGNVASTKRYLDPPTLENLHNSGVADGGSVALTHDFGDTRHLRTSFRRARSGFGVPNELLQEAAGQRQRRQIDDSSADLDYQQVLSPSWLFDVRGSFRRLASTLSANSHSTPILPWQDRRLDEQYVGGSISGERGRHNMTYGGDFVHTQLAENFRYSITDSSAFPDGVLPAFWFRQSTAGEEASWYAQDQITAGSFTAAAGLRWDYYKLLLRRTAVSPRLSAAYRVQPIGIVFHATYDRVFGTPATENLLLASSAAARTVTSADLGLPVPPQYANFYEVGAERNMPGGSRLSVSAFRRDFKNFADDDVFLNTGVSFPIAFSAAMVEGIETTLRVAIGRKVIAKANYSNLSGTASLPVTGGLFLDATPDLLRGHSHFRISQDQRNTASWSFFYQPVPRIWLGTHGWYGSGLPVEVDDAAARTDDPRILSRVDFARGRVLPSFSEGIEVGGVLWKHEFRQIEGQFLLDNVSNQLNVINFAGLFSGTAIGAPRSVHVRIRFSF